MLSIWMKGMLRISEPPETPYFRQQQPNYCQIGHQSTTDMKKRCNRHSTAMYAWILQVIQQPGIDSRTTFNNDTGITELISSTRQIRHAWSPYVLPPLVNWLQVTMFTTEYQDRDRLHVRPSCRAINAFPKCWEQLSYTIGRDVTGLYHIIKQPEDNKTVKESHKHCKLPTYVHRWHEIIAVWKTG